MLAVVQIVAREFLLVFAEQAVEVVVGLLLELEQCQEVLLEILAEIKRAVLRRGVRRTRISW